MRTFGVTLLLLLTMFSGVHAQDNALPPLAAVTDGQVRLYGLSGGVVTPQRWTPYLNLVWSPDGQNLAFTGYDDNFQPQIFLTNRNGAEPVLLVSQATPFPADFSSDSTRLTYAAPTTDPNLLDVLRKALEPEAEPESLGQIRFGTGCGGGSAYPMDAVYNAEAGFGGSHLTFMDTDYGILHSLNCAGVGLALLEGGSVRELSPSLIRAELSPDGTQVAAVDTGAQRITLVNLENGNFTPVGTQFNPDQIAWSSDGGAVYYSVRRLVDTPLPLAEAEMQAMTDWLGTPDVSIPQYTVNIYRVSLGNGQETEVFSSPGWAIGQMFASRGSLYFSLIPNGESWIEAVTSGSIDPNAPDRYFRERQSVAVTMFRLEANGTVTEVGADIGRASLHPSAR